jgi:hypothetical protein
LGSYTEYLYGNNRVLVEIADIAKFVKCQNANIVNRCLEPLFRSLIWWEKVFSYTLIPSIWISSPETPRKLVVIVECKELFELLKAFRAPFEIVCLSCGCEFTGHLL